jgi:two-component system LytT family response regulator
MSMLRVLTVDDETLALRRLKLLLQAMPYVEHVGEANSCAEALAEVAALAPDAILLDIKMRDGDGFEVIKTLAERPNPPAVIFVTAFDHYAVQAFENAIVDYLLKPVERERLARALRRVSQQLRSVDAEQRLSEMQEIVRNLRSVVGHTAAKPFETEFWLRGSAGLVRVSVDAIDCVSSEDDYVAIRTVAGSHLMRGSLRQFESRVEPGLFVRVHRRWLARKSAIMELRTPRFGRSEVVLRTGKRLPVGRVYLKLLRQSMRDGVASISIVQSHGDHDRKRGGGGAR